MKYLFTLLLFLFHFIFWGEGTGRAATCWRSGTYALKAYDVTHVSHVLVRSDTCGLLQKPMTSLMLVMSQHIVHYIFHEDFVCMRNLSNYL